MSKWLKIAKQVADQAQKATKGSKGGSGGGLAGIARKALGGVTGSASESADAAATPAAGGAEQSERRGPSGEIISPMGNPVPPESNPQNVGPFYIAAMDLTRRGVADLDAHANVPSGHDLLSVVLLVENSDTNTQPPPALRVVCDDGSEGIHRPYKEEGGLDAVETWDRQCWGEGMTRFAVPAGKAGWLEARPGGSDSSAPAAARWRLP